jgi:hypothetical protein
MENLVTIGVRVLGWFKELHQHPGKDYFEKIRKADGSCHTEDEKQRLLTEIFDTRGSMPEGIEAFTLALSILGRLDPSDERQVIEMQQWAGTWASAGLPIFSLTHGLAAALLLTDPPKLVEEDFHLPFPALVITVPPGCIPFHVDGVDEIVWGDTIRIEHRYDRCESSNDECVNWLYVSVHNSSGFEIWRSHQLSKVMDVSGDDFFIEQTKDTEFKLVEKDRPTIQVALRLVRNFVAWIEAHGVGVPEGRPRQSGQPYRLDRDDNPVPITWVVGREVKLSPELRRFATETALGGHPGWKLRMRFCVRGHWKLQACGEGRRDRKRIFVEPYWKGPTGAEAWSHVYTCTTSEEIS